MLFVGARKLIQEVRAVTRHLPGSNEERLVWQRRAFAMANKFGSAAVFFTFAPNDVGSVLLSFYAGQMDVDSIMDVGPEQLPIGAKRFAIVAKDPAAAAMNYQCLLDLVHEQLLGFDSATGRPLASGGIFGHCVAWLGCDETQARGSLHRHELIWLLGMPQTLEEFEELMSGKDNGEWSNR